MICANCEHEQSRHKGGTDGCRKCDLGCTLFEAPEAAVAEQTRVLTVVAEVCDDQAEKARAELAGRLGFDGESTSAKLRRVEQECDELRGQLATTEQTRDRISETATAAQNALMARNAELAAVREAAGRDIADPPEVDLRDRVAELRQGRAEATQRALELAEQLAAARTEIEAWSARYGEVVTELEKARQAAGIDPEQDRGVDLADRVQSIRDGRTEAIDAFVRTAEERNVLAELVRYLCETCGSRYGQPYTDHEHGRLTPVLVTTTRIEGATTA